MYLPPQISPSVLTKWPNDLHTIFGCHPACVVCVSQSICICRLSLPEFRVSSCMLQVAWHLATNVASAVLLICDVGQIFGQIMSLFVPFLANASTADFLYRHWRRSSTIVNDKFHALRALLTVCLSRSMSIGLLMAASDWVGSKILLKCCKRCLVDG